MNLELNREKSVLIINIIIYNHNIYIVPKRRKNLLRNRLWITLGKAKLNAENTIDFSRKNMEENI